MKQNEITQLCVRPGQGSYLQAAWYTGRNHRPLVIAEKFLTRPDPPVISEKLLIRPDPWHTEQSCWSDPGFSMAFQRSDHFSRVGSGRVRGWPDSIHPWYYFWKSPDPTRPVRYRTTQLARFRTWAASLLNPSDPTRGPGHWPARSPRFSRCSRQVH